MAYEPRTDGATIENQLADYVDRILKGSSPADLPVQAPTRYDLIVNLGAAREMGITIRPSVLSRADALY